MNWLVIFLLIISCNVEPFNTGEEFDSVEDAAQWVYTNIDYQYDSLGEWQTPRETYNKRTGDCEDYVILFSYFIQEYDPKMIIVRTGDNYHAMAEVDNRYYDITAGIWPIDIIAHGEIVQELTYSEMLNNTR